MRRFKVPDNHMDTSILAARLVHEARQESNKEFLIKQLDSMFNYPATTSFNYGGLSLPLAKDLMEIEKLVKHPDEIKRKNGFIVLSALIFSIFDKTNTLNLYLALLTSAQDDEKKLTLEYSERLASLPLIYWQVIEKLDKLFKLTSLRLHHLRDMPQEQWQRICKLFANPLTEIKITNFTDLTSAYQHELLDHMLLKNATLKSLSIQDSQLPQLDDEAWGKLMHLIKNSWLEELEFKNCLVDNLPDLRKNALTQAMSANHSLKKVLYEKD